MADAEATNATDWLGAEERDPPPPESPAVAFRAALSRYEPARLQEIHKAQGIPDLGLKPQSLSAAITEHLGDARYVERTLSSLELGPRIAATLFALTETTSWPLRGLAHALACLGVEPIAAIRTLTDLGLLAIWLGQDGGPVYEIGRFFEGTADARVSLRAHPTLVAAARTVLPAGEALPTAGPVRTIREADGLEAVIRMAAVWQRVAEEPLRQTQHGTLYKRDRERLEDDPVLAGPIADALEPLPDMAALWLTLAREVGLVVPESGGERIVAARPEFWEDNAIHLPQMIAVRWLSLRMWHEQGGMQQEGSTAELAWPYMRPAVFLWLATLPVDAWMSLEDLADHLRRLSPAWDLPCFLEASSAQAAPRGKHRRGRTAERSRSGPPEAGVLEACLLGAAYQLGLIRAAEEAETRQRVVQLTPLGRYVLALGPPPPPRPSFDHFLFVQPNFEIIAYRQGLNPALIGEFSRLAQWIQSGAALELKLTPGSVYRGLEGGMTTEAMLERLSRHSQRSLPAGVSEAIRTWAERRERVSYYGSATLIEFATREDLAAALQHWPTDGRPAPQAVSDRLLLVEDESAVPFQRFRLTGSRDYRRPPESCVEVEEDGVTIALDLARSDLLVDAELARFTDELPTEAPRESLGNPRRRFRISKASLERGAKSGLTTAVLTHWFQRRAGMGLPSAIRLMLLTSSGRVAPLETERPLLLHTPTSEVLDGLLQHPDTRAYFGPRLGPTAVIVPDSAFAPLQGALRRLGLSWTEPLAPSAGD